VNGSRSGGGEDEVVEDLRAMGAPDEVIEQYLREQRSEDSAFAIFPENWEAFELFNRMGTQWRTALATCGEGFISRLTGLDYTALEALMRMRPRRDKEGRIIDRAGNFERVRIMEIAALEAWAQQ